MEIRKDPLQHMRCMMYDSRRFKKTPLCEPCSPWCVLVPENAVYVFTEGIKQTYADTCRKA